MCRCICIIRKIHIGIDVITRWLTCPTHKIEDHPAAALLGPGELLISEDSRLVWCLMSRMNYFIRTTDVHVSACLEHRAAGEYHSGDLSASSSMASSEHGIEPNLRGLASWQEYPSIPCIDLQAARGLLGRPELRMLGLLIGMFSAAQRSARLNVPSTIWTSSSHLLLNGA